MPHNMYGTLIYRVWNSMIQRCTNPNLDNYNRYGGRGIKVCNRWLKFEFFYADMGDKPEGFSIDRIDNDGNYEPKNCKWSSMKEQQRNTRRNRFIEHEGITKPLIEWSEELNINYRTLISRMNKGWSTERALKKQLRRNHESR